VHRFNCYLIVVPDSQSAKEKMVTFLQMEVRYVSDGYVQPTQKLPIWTLQSNGWLARVYRSISSYNYNLCKDISQSMIYNIYFLYILCHISLSVADLDSRTVQIFVTSVHFQSLTRLGLVWCWVLKEQLQFVHPRISITWLSWIKML